jgi:O-antigen/teichoic acid export membrane protein
MPQVSIYRNYLYNASINAMNLLYPLVTFSYVSRVLGPVSFGKVGIAVSLATYFAMVAVAGMPLYGMREVARARHDPERLNRTFTELFTLSVIFSIASCILYGVALLLIGRTREDAALFLVAGGTVLSGALSVDWLFQALERYGGIMVRQVTGKLIALACLFFAVRSPHDYVNYVAIGVLTSAAVNCWGLLMGRSVASFRFRNLSLVRHLKPIWVLLGCSAVVSVYTYLDSVLLGLLSGDRSVGLYSAANRIARMSAIVATSLVGVVIPRVSSYVEKGRNQDRDDLNRRTARVVMLLCLPVVSALMTLAPEIMHFLAGGQYSGAVTALRILAPLMLFIGLNHVLGLQVLFPLGFERKVLFASSLAAVVSISLNLLLIPLLHQNGAAIACVSAELTGTIVLALMLLKKGIPNGLSPQCVAMYAAVSLLLAAVLLTGRAIFGNALPTLLFGGVVGPVVYIGTLWLVRDDVVRDAWAAVRRKVAVGAGG